MLLCFIHDINFGYIKSRKCVRVLFSFVIMEDYSSSSDDEFYLMALGIITAVSKESKKKRKRRYWVREIYRNRDVDGINSIVTTMRVSNRDSYFK